MFGHSETLTQQAKTNVEENKEADDQRVAPDCAFLHLVDQFNIFPILEIFAVENKAAHQKVDHAHQHAGSGKVGGKAVEVANGIFTQEGDGKETLYHIAKVDKEVKDKAPGDQGMEEISGVTDFPDRAKGGPLFERRHNTRLSISQRRHFALAASNHQIDIFEANPRIGQRPDHQGHKHHFFIKR